MATVRYIMAFTWQGICNGASLSCTGKSDLPMMEQRSFTREEALKYEAQRYLRRLQGRLAQFQSHKARLQEALHQREEGAHREAQSYLGNLSERAEWRANARARGEEEKKMFAELLRRQAEAYRERLRSYMRPGQVDDGEQERCGQNPGDELTP